MPVFFQHVIDADTRLGIWKIEETEQFFLSNVPVKADVRHPHKRLQHLAGRFLLRFLFPSFPYELIRIADTKKPFLENEMFHFSISHCGDFAAAIVSRTHRVGIDIEIPAQKIIIIKEKFLNKMELADSSLTIQHLTLLWSAKESVFKWYGAGGVDFSEHIRLGPINHEKDMIDCHFTKTSSDLVIRFHCFDHLVLTWVIS